VIEQRDAIASRQTKPRRVRGEAFCDHPGVIKALVEDLSRDLSNAGRIDVVSQQVTDHPPGPHYRKPAKQDPAIGGHPPSVEANI
jgi:hypothetical protein